jgi:hypothetical protein
MTLNELNGETTLSDATSTDNNKLVFPQELRKHFVSCGTTCVLFDIKRTLVAILRFLLEGDTNRRRQLRRSK